eukprot:5639848-Alexandrium_andersonii.AAC.1
MPSLASHASTHAHHARARAAHAAHTHQQTRGGEVVDATRPQVGLSAEPRLMAHCARVILSAGRASAWRRNPPVAN